MKDIELTRENVLEIKRFALDYLKIIEKTSTLEGHPYIQDDELSRVVVYIKAISTFLNREKLIESPIRILE